MNRKGRPPANIIPIARKLKKRYKDFSHHNRKNPLDELLLILCSVKRGEKVYLRAFKSLKQAFPTFEKLNQASVKELTKHVMAGRPRGCGYAFLVEPDHVLAVGLEDVAVVRFRPGGL